MSEIKQQVLDDIEIVLGDNAAIVDDASYIWDGEHHRLPIDHETDESVRTPVFIMLPLIIKLLERPEVEMVFIDGSGDRFEITAKTDKGFEFFSAHDIAFTKSLHAAEIKTNMALYFKTYYLLRYYLLGGSKKYAVTKLNEGFVVYTNDPENPRVWAGHKVY